MKIILKIIKIILILLASLFALMLLCLALTWGLFLSVNGKEQADQETVMDGQGTGKVLILYQESRMGLTEDVVNAAAETFQTEGYSVVMNHPREDSAYAPEDYDIIVLASPVYVGEVSKPLIAYAGSHDFAGKKVMVLLTGGDVNTQTELAKVQDQLANASFVKAIKVDQTGETLNSAVEELTAQ